MKTKDDKNVEVDLAPSLLELRKKWFETTSKPDRQAIIAQLPTVLKPWLDKVTAQRTEAETNIKAAGLDPAKLPADKSLHTAIEAAEELSKRIEALLKKLGTSLKKGQRAHIDDLVVKARKLLGEVGSQPADDAAAIAELRGLGARVGSRQSALVKKKWLDRVNALNAALISNPSFVFGESSGKEVSDPSLAQLVDTGFFTLRGTPKAGNEAFDVDFVKSMVKHGFTHGATWSTPDLMHFELRWAKPAPAPAPRPVPEPDCPGPTCGLV